MLIGLSIGIMAIQNSLKAHATMVLAAPVGLLAIPILDTTAAILRRKLTGRSIYTTDRGHLHHCLLAQGWGTRWTLLIISCSCTLTAVGALASLAFNNEWFGFLCALTVVSASHRQPIVWPYGTGSFAQAVGLPESVHGSSPLRRESGGV